MLHFVIFLRNSWISNFALEHRGADLLCQRIFSSICDVGYEEERSWSAVNRTVLKTDMAPNHISSNQIIYRYPPREESAQKEERSVSILRHTFQKYPLTPQFCAAVLGRRFAHKIIICFKSRSAICEKYVWKSILHTFKIYLKIDNFGGRLLL